MSLAREARIIQGFFRKKQGEPCPMWYEPERSVYFHPEMSLKR
jgi:hypothetical protein